MKLFLHFLEIKSRPLILGTSKNTFGRGFRIAVLLFLVPAGTDKVYDSNMCAILNSEKNVILIFLSALLTMIRP